MNTLYKMPANDTYQALDSEQKQYIDILRSSKNTPAEVEDALLNFFQCSIERMFTTKKVCDTLSALVDNQELLSNAVIKMAKNESGITNFIAELSEKPDFMNYEAWNIVTGNDPVKPFQKLAKKAMTA